MFDCSAKACKIPPSVAPIKQSDGNQAIKGGDEESLRLRRVNSTSICSGSLVDDGAAVIRQSSYKGSGHPSAPQDEWGCASKGLQIRRESRRRHTNSSHSDHDSDIKDDLKDTNPEDDDKEIVLLPESTHSLLFTECASSLPFWFAAVIALMSLWCLILALLNNLDNGTTSNPVGIPVNVGPAVRGAQYLAIFVALLMEEEIPTGLYLIRMFPVCSLAAMFPHIKFARFFWSALLRILLGYLFLLNVFLVVVQAEGVLDIFYDMLALQFVQQLDDIAFNLAKMDVLGRRMKRACTGKWFRTEVEGQLYIECRKMNFSLKALYFVNSFVMLAGMIYVTVLQKYQGYYQCSTITVNFGDDIWEDAIVKSPSGGINEMILVYSYFNGVYEEDGMHDGRPRYVERNKKDSTPFLTTVGAEIKYCSGLERWVFTHPNIMKADTPEDDSEGCFWLAKSEETKSYDLLETSGQWDIWTGVIVNGATMTMTCNECEGNTDCNLNGVCSNSKCICHEERGAFGIHCQHRKPCETMLSNTNETWSLVYLDELNKDFYVEYGRPVYALQDGMQGKIGDNDVFGLMYTGSRWFGIFYENMNNASMETWIAYGRDFHGFWSKVYNEQTVFVSDHTTSSSPIGVDFYEIGERGEQYGPFGVLYPYQEPQGRGALRCIDNSTRSKQHYGEELKINEVRRLYHNRGV